MLERSESDSEVMARSVFAGLVPRSPQVEPGRPAQDFRRSPSARAAFATVPIVLVGSLAAMTLTAIEPAEQANAKPIKPRGAASDLGKTIRGAMATANAALKNTSSAFARGATAPAPTPSVYQVQVGDTVSDIAGRYGLATASVLALNGLGWSSMIFPGQELKLSNESGLAPVIPAPAAAQSGRYTIVGGDTISAIADRFGVSTLSLLSANGLGWSSIIYPGQTLAIPGLVGPGAPLGDASSDSDASAGSTTFDLVDSVLSAPPAPATTPVAPPAAAAPEPPAPAPAAPAAPVYGSSYTVVSGDTISGIAARFGISTDDLLAANGLDWSSTIYLGDTLQVPGSGVASTGGDVVLMTDEMRGNAAVIVQVGRNLGVSDYGIVIALATAMQESRLRNLNWGDLDSVGLFQQRPSAGWGSVDQLTDPYYAAALFYGGPGNPNSGYTRGLLDITGWDSMSVAQAAQAVQISAYPDAYAKWESSAREWLSELG